MEYMFRQSSGWPLLHASQMPHIVQSSTMTLSPGATLFTFFPTSTTSPAISWPSGMGSSVQSRTKLMSVPHTPQARTFTMTWSSSGPPISRTRSWMSSSFFPKRPLLFIAPLPAAQPAPYSAPSAPG